MAIQFILGRAGSGKTRLCLDQIAEQLNNDPEGPNLIMLVPDQATFQLEQELVKSCKAGAVTRAVVYSFRRLAWRIVDAAGGLPHPHIGPMGKAMLIRKVVHDRRHDLQLFSGPVRPGAAARISALLSEFSAADCSPQQISTLAARCKQGTTLAAKLHDLAIIGSEIEDRLSAQYSDPDQLIRTAVKRASECGLLTDAIVWVDGFAGFTEQELLMLKSLWEQCSVMRIALCMDADCTQNPVHQGSLFYPCHRTYNRLLGLAAQAGIDTLQPLLLDQSPPPRYRDSPALATIEADMVTGKRDGELYSGDVTVVTAANRRAEVDAAAAHVLSLVRDQGLQWRDIAVLVPSLDPYGSLIKNVFADHDIPTFIDRLRPAVHHPAVQIILSVLELMTGAGYQPIVAMLRTGLIQVAPDIVDRLDNDAVAGHKNSKHWLRRTPIADMKKTYRSLSGREIVAIKRALQPVVRCCREMSGRIQIQQAVRTLFTMMLRLKVPETLATWSEQAVAAGEPEMAQEHRRIWSGLVDLANQLVSGAGSEVVTAAELEPIITAGVRELRLGMIPPTLDQVIVGAVDRSRQPPVRSTLVLGCNEGMFFANSDEDPGLSDSEREYLGDLGADVGVTARERAFSELYLTYIALTRAAESLWVSYALADDSGRPQLPARFVEWLCCYRGVSEYRVGPDGDNKHDTLLTGKSAIRDLLPMLRGGELTGYWSDVYGWAKRQERYQWLLSAAREDGSVLPIASEVLEAWQDRMLSVTALEHYGDCPFRFFARYVLRLKRRKTGEFQAVDRGNVVHGLLTRLTPVVVEMVEAGQCTDVDLDRLVDDGLAQYLVSVGYDLSEGKDQIMLEDIRDSLWWALWLIRIHCERGQFRPRYYEWGFSPDGEDNIRLQGRVDRIDTAITSDSCYMRVVEYKTGRAEVDIGEILFGLSLQLPLYMDRVLAAIRDAIPAGILSFRVQTPRVRYDRRPDQDLMDKVLESLRPQGLVLSDPTVIRLMDNEPGTHSQLIPAGLKKDGQPTKRASIITTDQMQDIMSVAKTKAEQFVDSIQHGRFAISPARYRQRATCKYCDYRPLCGYDPLLSGHRPRRLVVDDDVWTLIREVVNCGQTVDS